MYTFNGYETGVTWDKDDRINPEHFDNTTLVG
jgi:hypothetical protein